MNDEFRSIPGYAKYGVNNHGVVVSLERGLILGQHLLDGYLIVDTFRGSLTETLPVHRAVALAWVNNPDPEWFTLVNHKDGVTLNNGYLNLEWTNHSGNNYHAVNNGLRSDNIPCKVRDFHTGVVYDLSSIAQAAEFMGLRKDSPIIVLRPKMFGKLITDRFEFRYADDPTPWFYQDRTERVPPSRYMIVVKEPDGSTREIYSLRMLLREYQLYSSPDKSIPGLVRYGNSVYPDKEFTVFDSYTIDQHRVLRATRESRPMAIRAIRNSESSEFSSLTQCADHFGVDRSTVLGRLDNGKEFDGWTFTKL